MANKNKKNKRGGKRSIFKKTKQNKKRKTIKRKIIKNYKKKTKLHKGGENLKSNKLSLDEIITELKREELYIKLRAPGTTYFKNQKTVNSLYNTFVELLDDIIILMKRIVDNIYSLKELKLEEKFNTYKKKYNDLKIEDIMREYYQFFKKSTKYISEESFTSNVAYKELIKLRDNLTKIDEEMQEDQKSLHIAGDLITINERKINNLMKIE